MQRVLTSLALCLSALLCAACGGGGDNTNAVAKKSDRITVTYPNLFLQGDEAERGKVTCELEEVFGEVLPYESANGNANVAVDRPDVEIRPPHPDGALSNPLTITDHEAIQVERANKTGLQWSTVRNLAMAWVLTLPVSICLSASLFWMFRTLAK